jgi:hypothetical protein
LCSCHSKQATAGRQAGTCRDDKLWLQGVGPLSHELGNHSLVVPALPPPVADLSASQAASRRHVQPPMRTGVGSAFRRFQSRRSPSRSDLLALDVCKATALVLWHLTAAEVASLANTKKCLLLCRHRRLTTKKESPELLLPLLLLCWRASSTDSTTASVTATARAVPRETFMQVSDAAGVTSTVRVASRCPKQEWSVLSLVHDPSRPPNTGTGLAGLLEGESPCLSRDALPCQLGSQHPGRTPPAASAAQALLALRPTWGDPCQPGEASLPAL